MSRPELAELEEIRALIASGRHLGALTYGEVATAVAELDRKTPLLAFSRCADHA